MKSTHPSLRYIIILTIAILFSNNSNLFAQSGNDSIKIANDIPAATKKAYYSIDKHAIVASADTAGKNWDLAFLKTAVWVNSGVSGTGSTTALVLKNVKFDDIKQAPATGYQSDSATQKAIPQGSGNGWYAYDMNTHTITPVPGRVIILHTASGKYVKLEVLNYYKNGDGDPSHYTFRYAFIEPAK